MQVEGESVETRQNTSIEWERWDARLRGRSTIGVEKPVSAQTDDEDVSGTPQHHPPPFPNPDDTARPKNEPPSVELEGRGEEIRAATSSQHVDDTSTQRGARRGPPLARGHRGERNERGDVEHDWELQSGGNSVRQGRKGGGKDGAASDTRHESK
jgi:hypothetical protein